MSSSVEDICHTDHTNPTWIIDPILYRVKIQIKIITFCVKINTSLGQSVVMRPCDVKRFEILH